MSKVTSAARASAPQGAAPPTRAAQTRWLLAGGAVAGPLFVIVAAGQVLTIDGFDLGRHPLSLLSAGEHGWIQILNFVVAGVLSVGFAVALHRVLRPGRAGTWGPLLMGVFGVGLVAGGVFVADPALGFPPGAPQGIPTTMTWHAAVHGFAPVVAFNAVIIACFVLARRFLGLRQRGWAACSVSTGVLALGFAAWPGMDGISWRLAVAILLTFAWQSALAVHLARDVHT
jgi:hypothetical protein